MINYITWIRNFAVEVVVIGALGAVLGGGVVWWVRGLQVQAAEGQVSQLKLDLKQAEVDSLNSARTSGEEAVNGLKQDFKKIDQVASDVRRLGKRISLCDANGGSVQVPAVSEGTDAETGNGRTRPAEEVLRELTERLFKRADEQAAVCNRVIELIEKNQSGSAATE